MANLEGLGARALSWLVRRSTGSTRAFGLPQRSTHGGERSDSDLLGALVAQAPRQPIRAPAAVRDPEASSRCSTHVCGHRLIHGADVTGDGVSVLLEDRDVFGHLVALLDEHGSQVRPVGTQKTIRINTRSSGRSRSSCGSNVVPYWATFEDSWRDSGSRAGLGRRHSDQSTPEAPSRGSHVEDLVRNRGL
jgi:hypothetical protein